MKEFFCSTHGKVIAMIIGVFAVMALVLMLELCRKNSGGDDNQEMNVVGENDEDIVDTVNREEQSVDNEKSESKGSDVVEDSHEDVLDATNWETESDDNKKSEPDNRQNTQDNGKDSNENRTESNHEQDTNNKDNDEKDLNVSDDERLQEDNNKVPGADKVWGPLH